jgi:hypothetical protein
MRDLLALEPGRDPPFNDLISFQTPPIEQMLVKGADQDKQAIAPLLKPPDQALESLPLQRCLRIDPRIILLGYAALVPGLWQVPPGIVGNSRLLSQRF